MRDMTYPKILSHETVLRIRKLRAEGMTYRDIAAMTGVAPSVAYNAINGKGAYR